LAAFEQGAVMQRRFCARSIAIVGTVLTVTPATYAFVEQANAQAMQGSGFNEFDSRWAFATPFAASGLNADSNVAGISRQAFTAPLGSGTVGLLVESGRDGAGSGGIPGNLFGTMLASPLPQRQGWFANLANPDWRTSVFASYHSAPITGLFNGLYTTASFGITGISTAPPAFSGLPNFTSGNDVVGVTARAGVGLQLTPSVTVEGSVSWTQVPNSAFR
jgi:hypothetical protein